MGHSQSSLYVSLICISVPILTWCPAPMHPCLALNHTPVLNPDMASLRCLLYRTRPQLDPCLKDLASHARRLEERAVAWIGQRQERGRLNQPAGRRPSINPPNGLGWRT